MDKNLPNLLVLSNPAGLYDPAPNGYSPLAIIDSHAKLIVISGQGGETEDGALDPDFRTQVRQACAICPLPSLRRAERWSRSPSSRC